MMFVCAEAVLIGEGCRRGEIAQVNHLLMPYEPRLLAASKAPYKSF